jgi:hypothetical protein
MKRAEKFTRKPVSAGVAAIPGPGVSSVFCLSGKPFRPFRHKACQISFNCFISAGPDIREFVFAAGHSFPNSTEF